MTFITWTPRTCCVRLRAACISFQTLAVSSWDFRALLDRIASWRGVAPATWFAVRQASRVSSCERRWRRDSVVAAIRDSLRRSRESSLLIDEVCSVLVATTSSKYYTRNTRAWRIAQRLLTDWISFFAARKVRSIFSFLGSHSGMVSIWLPVTFRCWRFVNVSSPSILLIQL